MCTQVTASEPSPIANPTLFVEPDLMSPAASNRGTVVSNEHGLRSFKGQCPDCATSVPVRMKPLSSRFTSSGIQAETPAKYDPAGGVNILLISRCLSDL